MKGKHTDDNQAAIVSALRQVGCLVLDLSAVGGGCPDLLVAHPATGRLLFVEVKNPQGRNRVDKRQREWHTEWAGFVAVVRSVEEALSAVGVVVT